MASGLLALGVGKPELDEHLRQAQADLDAEKYAEAARELRAAIVIQPALRGAYYQLGFALFQLSDFQAAEKAFTKELTFQPPDPYSLYYLGRIRAEQGQRVAAISFFTKSIGAGEVLDVRQRLGSSYLAAGRVEEAIQFLETSVTLRPEDGGLHYLLARAYKQKGAEAKSKTEFEAAARWKAKFRNEMVALAALRNDLRTNNQPDSLTQSKELFASGDSDILLASATALGQAGLHSEAVPFLQKALSIHSAFPEAHYDLGRAYLALNKPDEARSELLKATELKPGFYEAELVLGTLLADAGQGEESIKHLRAAVELRPNKSQLLMLLAMQYYHQNYFADSIEILKKAISADPESPDPQFLLIEAYYRNLEYEHALSFAREVVARFPDNALSHYHLGAQLNNFGKPAESKVELERAIAKDPKLAEAQAMLGDVLFKMGKPEESVECFRRVLATDPKSMEAHAGLGKALIQLKRYPEAASAMEEAIQIDSNLASLHLYLSQAYRALGRGDDAKREAVVFSRLNQERANAKDREIDRKYPN